VAKVILKYRSWKEFLKNEPDLIDSLWDLVPKPMEVVGFESVVFTDKNLYHLKYKGKLYLVWCEEIDKFVED
jgi:hypothetical protein